jgi:hypothetical protein
MSSERGKNVENGEDTEMEERLTGGKPKNVGKGKFNLAWWSRLSGPCEIEIKNFSTVKTYFLNCQEFFNC